MIQTTNKMEQEKELLTYFNTLTNMKNVIEKTHGFLNGDHYPYEKLSCMNRFRKELEPLLNNLDIHLRTPRNTFSHEVPRHSKASPSLWVSGFSEKTTRNDLYQLFISLDARLGLENIAHRGHYAFINFRDTGSAERANAQEWTLHGTVLDTNVRYPR